MVRQYLFRHGVRYRLHVRTLPGRPDVVLSKYHTVILVHGCFWHQHVGCRYAREPLSNRAYWLSKLQATTDRDAVQSLALQQLGWKTLVVWECELKRDPSARCQKLLNEIFHGSEP